MLRTLSVILLVSALTSPCQAAPQEPEDVDQSAITTATAESVYSYDRNNPPEVFFFPKEKARWDGAKVTLSEWYLLTETQKERFINEYLGQLQSSYKLDFSSAGSEYLKALNVFSSYSDEKSLREPSTKFIDIILSGQGKMNLKERPRSEAKTVAAY